ncbi:unnamed protein product [Heligmosomoides polygyrus]|uniref:Calponin-homology (CH) domain-containing protein n=1 Tax=Heligmosomoides polygyrus TaxID=6339 RepID=A0A3P8BSB0_HELPZ|nr:unnamed protein product [Heligmosomoides polygyrus]
MNEHQFWEHPLGSWLSDVALGFPPVVEEKNWRLPGRIDLPLQYEELCDGVLLSVLFHQIDPSSVDLVSPREVRLDEQDLRARQRLFASLIDAIRKLYKVIERYGYGKAIPRAANTFAGLSRAGEDGRGAMFGNTGWPGRGDESRSLPGASFGLTDQLR